MHVLDPVLPSRQQILIILYRVLVVLNLFNEIYIYVIFFNKEIDKSHKKTGKTSNFKVSVNNNIPSVWFLRE